MIRFAPIPNLGVSNAIRLALVGWAKTLAGEVASACRCPEGEVLR